MSIKNIQHIWFDLAGTLYKETPEFNEVHDNFRYNTYAKVAKNSDPDTAKSEFLKLYDRHGSNSAVFRSMGKPSDFWMKQLDNLDFTQILKPDAEITDTLAALKKIVPISLFTNFAGNHIGQLLNHLEIPPTSFTFILTGDDITERKPALDGFHAMIKKSKISASHILYVGDRVDVDIEPAKQVGIKTCLLYSESTEADYCLKSFKDLLTLFSS